MTHGTMPLFERYPGTAALPLAGIAVLPTPIEWPEAEWFENEPIGPVWVKRDGLTNPVYGGNKVRKLDFLLGDALAKGAKTVLTFGAYGSNHALATAVFASELGLEPHVVLSPQELGPYAPATLLAHAGLGTVLHLADGWDGKRAAVTAIRELTSRDGVEPYIIPMGGSNALGCVGYVNAALEAVEQSRTAILLLAQPDVVYVAAGTLGTAIGLAIGFAAAGVGTRVEAIRVTPPEVANDQTARLLAATTVAQLRMLDESFPALEFEDLAFALRDEFFEPGYGVVTPQTREALSLAEQAGVKLETTYTGKAFSAMLEDARVGRLHPDEQVLFWETYSSAPMPAAGPIEALPAVLRDYIAACEREFGLTR